MSSPAYTVKDLPEVKCGECGSPMVLKESKFDRSPFWWSCSRYPKCRGSHGAHPDGRPLGVPANQATKNARILAHAAFDALWKGGAMKRSFAYRRLTEAMGGEKQVHIGELTIEECERVVAVCSQKTTGAAR